MATKVSRPTQEVVVNYFFHLAEEVCEIMAKLGLLCLLPLLVVFGFKETRREIKGSLCFIAVLE
jgi:hypothetical protein